MSGDVRQARARGAPRGSADRRSALCLRAARRPRAWWTTTKIDALRQPAAPAVTDAFFSGAKPGVTQPKSATASAPRASTVPVWTFVPEHRP